MNYWRIPIFGLCLVASAASATSYSCKSDLFCECQSARGCSSLAQYFPVEPQEKCSSSQRTFDASTAYRQIVLDGDDLKLTLEEVRPYFSDFDWYQAGATDGRGLINLSFDTRNMQTDFQMRQMVKGAFNEHLWTLSGSCEANK